MTREDAIKELKKVNTLDMPVRLCEAYYMSIEALEQKTCEDAINRQMVLDLAYDMSEIDGEHFTEPCMVVDVEDIQKLPSVNPQEPFKPMVEIDLYSVIKQKYIERDVLDKIRAEINRQEKWLLQAGYTAYNADIAFDTIKSVLAKSEESNEIHEGCDGCAHIDDGFDEEPCKWCRYNYEDKWEAKK